MELNVDLSDCWEEQAGGAEEQESEEVEAAKEKLEDRLARDCEECDVKMKKINQFIRTLA